MEVTADLVAEVERQFVESEIESVISLLGDLDSARVQRAVVRLADGDIDRLLHFIAPSAGGLSRCHLLGRGTL